MNILVVEDDPEIAAYLTGGLREHGHTVTLATNGTTGLQLAHSVQDVLIVDRLLPGMDGLDMVKAVRAHGLKTPILFLTALGEVEDRVQGLRAGGDDYLLKPFALPELLARIEALARRSPLADQPLELHAGDLNLNLLTRIVTRAGTVLDLQPQEFRLLEYLLRHTGQVVTKTMLLENVWNFHFDPQTSLVETHISRLRTKIDKGFPTEMLLTVRGVGYCLKAQS